MGRSVGVPSGRQMSRQMSVHRPVMTTGRNQVIPLDPKPDLWKVAFNSMRAVSRFRVGMVLGNHIRETRISYLMGSCHFIGYR